MAFSSSSYISESQLHPALRKKIQYLQRAVAVSVVFDLVLLVLLVLLFLQRR